MAYLDPEFRSVSMLWQTVGDRVLTFVLIAAGMCFASWLLLMLGYPDASYPPIDALSPGAV